MSSINENTQHSSTEAPHQRDRESAQSELGAAPSPALSKRFQHTLRQESLAQPDRQALVPDVHDKSRQKVPGAMLHAGSDASPRIGPLPGLNTAAHIKTQAAAQARAASYGAASDLRTVGLRLRTFKAVLFALGLVPVARWVVLGVMGQLGANPIEFLIRSAGTWTFICLLVTLSVTPLRVITRQHALIHVRRMCGLFTFFYACVHFLMYVWWDQWFDFSAILNDIAQRPFIALGFLALLGLIPLAATSSKGWMRRLGRGWQRLHRLIYLVGLLALGHFWLHRAGKNDFFTVYIFGAVLVSLLVWRLVRAGYRRWPKTVSKRQAAPR